MPSMPDDQVVVGDIPGQRPGFQPRPALLTRLNRPREGSPAVVLMGARGVGKTQLAAAYARARLAGGWRLIAWVNARDSESLLAGLAAVAEAAGLSDVGSWHGLVDPGHAVRRWLEADGSRCLLVFDDAEDPGLLEPFVPAAGAARILISMAREAVEELGKTVQVDVFSAEEAQALLAGRTGLTDEAGASAVAAELGYLPLALDQAAAVIAEQHLGYAEYLARLKALPVGDYLVHGEDGEEQPYPPGVAEAVLLSLEAAWASDPIGVCAGVMETMAVLSPAAVHRDLLHAAGQAGTLLGRGRRVAGSLVDQALERLDERSLLCFGLDGQAVTVHCLVARVVRGGLVRRGRLAAACRAAASALEMSAEAIVKPQDHAAVREMLSQVTALLENAGEHADDADEKLTGMLMRLRFLALRDLKDLGDNMPHTVAIGEPLIAELERVLGPDHPDTLNARNSLAAAYQAAGRAADAIPLFEHVLVARERVLGPKHPDTLTSQNNLAATYQDAGRHAEAILLFKLTLAARERLFGADHPQHAELARQPCRRLPRHGPGQRGDPLLEQTLAGRNGCWARTTRTFGRAGQPGRRAAGDGPDRRDAPARFARRTVSRCRTEPAEEPVPGPMESSAAPSSDDAAPEAISESPVGLADEEKLPAEPAEKEPPAAGGCGNGRSAVARVRAGPRSPSQSRKMYPNPRRSLRSRLRQRPPRSRPLRPWKSQLPKSRPLLRPPRTRPLFRLPKSRQPHPRPMARAGPRSPGPAPAARSQPGGRGRDRASRRRRGRVSVPAARRALRPRLGGLALGREPAPQRCVPARRRLGRPAGRPQHDRGL